jgi:hypothetical protein
MSTAFSRSSSRPTNERFLDAFKINSLLVKTMTSMYKTAYPYYTPKKKISEDVIAKDYELTLDEITLIKKRTPGDTDAQLCFGVMLIVFKNLNYFPRIKNRFRLKLVCLCSHTIKNNQSQNLVHHQ